jgi:adenylate cyclase
VRGYTALTEGLAPGEVPELVNRFYETSSHAMLPHGALLGQIEGDNVMAMFVPGLAGKHYRSRAVTAGRALLQAMGYGSNHGNWLDVGVGISSGEEFVGNVGGGGYKDFTAVGDVTNTAARLTAQAAGGEILVDVGTFAAVAEEFPDAPRRTLELKGKSAPVTAHIIPSD